MPHKANPTRSVLVASAARQLPALASVVGAPPARRRTGRPATGTPSGSRCARCSGWPGARPRAPRPVGGLSFDPGATARNLGLLLAALGRDDAWAAEQTGTSACGSTGCWPGTRRSCADRGRLAAAAARAEVVGDDVLPEPATGRG